MEDSKETRREEARSTRELEKEGKTASAAETPLYRPAGAPQAPETSPRWPGGITTHRVAEAGTDLDPQGVDEKTLQEMRPDSLRAEELRRLRKREEELEMERTILLHERASLQRQL